MSNGRRSPATGPGTSLNSEDVRVSIDTQTNGGQTNAGEVPALELKGLCKSFGGLQATREVTLRIMPGDRQAIIGPNGAGKTTLFNLITGIYPVTSGQVLLFGQDVTDVAEPPAHRARHGAHVPGHQPVSETHRARQRACLRSKGCGRRNS